MLRGAFLRKSEIDKLVAVAAICWRLRTGLRCVVGLLKRALYRYSVPWADVQISTEIS